MRTRTPLDQRQQAALQTAARAFSMGDHPRALGLCQALLRQTGPRPDVLNLKGLAELHAGQPEAASESLKAALRLEPNRAELHLNAALALEALGDWRAVKQHATQAARLAPDVPRVLYQASRCARNAQDYALALRLADRALQRAPDDAAAWHLKGSIHLDLGEFEPAREAMQGAVARDPQHARALAMLVSLEKSSLDDTSRVNQLRALVASPLPAEERSTAAFALAGIQRRAGRHAEAFRGYREANALAAAARPFDLPAWEARMDRVATREPLPAPDAQAGENRVFIVGMPRSGTTLCEQVLSAHSAVHGCGELESLRVIEEQLGQAPGAQALRQAARRYADTLPPGADQARVTVDKAMMNFERVDLLLTLFPRACVIWCRRHPLDTVLSCWFQNFQAGLDWSMNLDAIVAIYIRHEAMMQHWLARYPQALLAVRYEDLVDDLDGQAHRLCARLGLPFEDAMLAPHRARRAVVTASNQQVRQPLYRSSMGYWKDYRDELTPAIEAFRSAGVAMPGVD